MKGNITLTMIKPTAMEKGYAGKIITRVLEAGFKLKAMKMLQLTKSQAMEFYGIHAGKPFYDDLVKYM